MKYLITLSAFLLVLFTPVIGQEDYKDKDLKESYINSNPYPVEVIDYKNAKLKKTPKNIILLIGDGMGISHVFAAYTANGGQLNITNMPYSGFSATQSASHFTTDSGAGGTALATGVRTNNGAIGLDANNTPVPSILTLAAKNGKSTGLVASSAITHATPASFVANQPKRSMYEEIAADLVNVNVDVFIGGGKKFFEKRKDGKNLLQELKEKDYHLFDSMDEALSLNSGKLAVLAAETHCPPYPERGELLPQGTKKAIELLSQNRKGFFLMVEGSQIDWGGHQNNTGFVVKETHDFDRAVGEALKFAAIDGETLVIVTADHETGGMSINGGNFETKEVTAKYTTGGHTPLFVPIFSFGPGAEQFSGVMNNTDVFHKMNNLLNFK